MVQEIIRWCNAHFAKGERVVGQTWTLAIGEPGAKPREFELDACEDCAAPFAGLIADLQENAVQTGGSKRSVGAVPAASNGVPTTAKPYACMLCTSASSSEAGLNAHLRDYHDTSLAEQNGEATVACVVPACKRKMVSGTGLASHLRIRHSEWLAEHPEHQPSAEAKAKAAAAKAKAGASK